MFLKTSRTIPYVVRNRFASIFATFLRSLGRFPHLPKSAMFKTMGYSPGFLVKIGRFRLIANSPENFTNKSLRTQKSICKHVGDVCREFGPISSTCQNQPFSKPWPIAQAFWSKSADFVSLQILPKTSRTSLSALRNPFCKDDGDVFREFWPISSTYQNPPSSNPWAIAQAFCSKSADFGSLQILQKTSRTIPYVVRNPFASILRRFQGVWADFQHLPKSALFKTMGFLVKIGRFRLIPNSPEIFTNNPLRSQKSIWKHLGDVFREFCPISSTYQNPPSSKPWAIAQAFRSKSADFGSFQILSKTSRTSLSAVRNPFASIFVTFLGSLGRYPALAKISNFQNHGLQPRLFGQNRPISAHSKFSRKRHEQCGTQLEIHLQAYLRRLQGVWADFQHLPKSALFKTMGYSPGFSVKIGRFRLIPNSLENVTNESFRSQESIWKHICDVFREFGPISSTCQNQQFSKPWAIAQAFWSKSADFGSFQILPKTSRTMRYVVGNTFASIFATFVGSLGRFPALAKITHVQNHGLQPRLLGQNRPISSH